MPEHDDELATSQTEGFKVGEKKTIEEYKNLGILSLFFSIHSRTIAV